MERSGSWTRVVQALVLATGFVSSSHAVEEPPLVFASIADLHCLDDLLADPVSPDFLTRLDTFLDGVAALKPAFVIMPGDLGGQRWWNPGDALCRLPGTTLERVRACADVAYPALKLRMALHGLDPVYVAVGDHEIGDNNWPLGDRAQAVGAFKDAFARHFTENADGSSRFDGTIGGVPLRPIGTRYARTSYAFVAGSALFVAVDEFRQDDPARVIGRRGTVEVTVGDDGHLQWLEQLLAAARQEPSIHHILVYGHVPVLSPVRGVATSNIYLEPRERSRFWRLLREYRVDAYLAGEVHATTVIKDGDRPLFQIVHAGGCGGASGFVLGRIYPDRLEFDQEMLDPAPLVPAPLAPKAYAAEGTLVLDKSGGQFRYTVTGKMLQPIDPAGLVIRYPFDSDPAQAVPNLGSFGSLYDAHATSVQLQPDAGGYGFADVDGSGVQTPGVTPISGDQPRTVSVWLRTTADSAGAYLYPSGGLFRVRGGFRLFVAHGVLGLELDKRTRVLANQGALRLDDGQWHHVAVTYPGPGALVDDVRFYLDGQPFAPATPLSKRIYTETILNSVAVGNRTNNPSLEGWTGSLRDFALWASALTAPMVKAVESCAGLLQYHAGDMEALFRLYRSQGTAAMKGTSWHYATSVPGEIGVCVPTADAMGYTLRLSDADGMVGSAP